MLKDVARWRKDSTAILIWLGIPFLVGGLLTAMMDGDGGGTPRGLLLIVDEDATFVSGLVAGAYTQGPVADLLTVETTDLADGTTRINAGQASGLLVIPAGFGAALFESEPVTLKLTTNPAQTILPGIIIDVTEILLDAGFYLNQLFGDEIGRIGEADTEGVPDEVFVSAIAVAIQQKFERVSPHLFPPSIDLTITEPPEEEPRVPLALLFLPGIILMAVLFSSSSLADDFWAEREAGTLRRLIYAPGRLTSFVIGKALAAAAVIGVVSGLALIAGFAYHGLPWSRLPSSLLWLAVSGVALFSWFAVLQMALPSKRAAAVITMVILFPLLMAGGSFFPLAVLPEWIAAIGRLSPNGFVADRLATEITAASAWAIDATSWSIILGMATVGLGVCVLRLKSGFASGST